MNNIKVVYLSEKEIRKVKYFNIINAQVVRILKEG